MDEVGCWWQLVKLLDVVTKSMVTNKQARKRVCGVIDVAVWVHQLASVWSCGAVLYDCTFQFTLVTCGGTSTWQFVLWPGLVKFQFYDYNLTKFHPPIVWKEICMTKVQQICHHKASFHCFLRRSFIWNRLPKRGVALQSFSKSEFCSLSLRILN